MGSSVDYRFWLKDLSAAWHYPRAHFLLILACEHAWDPEQSAMGPHGRRLMFQLFNNHSSTGDSDQTASRMGHSVLDEQDPLSLSGERPATYDEMLPWLLLGAAVGF